MNSLIKRRPPSSLWTRKGPPTREAPGGAARARAGRLRSFALACFFVGAGSMVLTDSGWAHAVGVLNRFAFAGSAFVRAAGSPDDQG